MMNSAQIKIYNFTSGNSIPLTWGEIYALAEKHLFDNPLEVNIKGFYVIIHQTIQCLSFLFNSFP